MKRWRRQLLFYGLREHGGIQSDISPIQSTPYLGDCGGQYAYPSGIDLCTYWHIGPRAPEDTYILPSRR